MKYLLWAALASLTACAFARADAAATERELRKLIDDLNTSLTKADMAFQERLLHRDFLLVSSRGQLENRARYLANRRTGQVTYATKVSDEIKVRLHGDTAIVTGRDTEKGRDRQGVVEGQYRWTRVFVREDGRWQLLAVQFTAVAK